MTTVYMTTARFNIKIKIFLKFKFVSQLFSCKKKLKLVA